MSLLFLRRESERGFLKITDDGFADWLARNPEPKLQDMVDRAGGYWQITDAEWDAFTAARDAWRERYRLRNNTRRP